MRICGVDLCRLESRLKFRGRALCGLEVDTRKRDTGCIECILRLTAAHAAHRKVDELFKLAVGTSWSVTTSGKERRILPMYSAGLTPALVIHWVMIS